jgi:drug/metabolite transporter (DMT)-like permease
MAGTRPDRLTLLVFVIVVVLGGINAVWIRVSNRELDPVWGATWRFGLAAIIFFSIMVALRLPFPKGRALLGALIYGLIGMGFGFALIYYGLNVVSAGVGQVIIALTPLLTFFFALAHKLERFRSIGLIGALVAVVGIGIGFGEQLSASVPLLPLLAMVGGAACFAESNVIVKLFPGAHPITTNAVASAVGALFLFGLSTLLGERQSLPQEPVTWVALVYLAAVGTVVLFALSLLVLMRWTASAAAYQNVLFPFDTVFVAALALGEPVTWPLLIGGLLVLAGVFIGSR